MSEETTSINRTPSNSFATSSAASSATSITSWGGRIPLELKERITDALKEDQKTVQYFLEESIAEYLKSRTLPSDAPEIKESLNQFDQAISKTRRTLESTLFLLFEERNTLKERDDELQKKIAKLHAQMEMEKKELKMQSELEQNKLKEEFMNRENELEKRIKALEESVEKLSKENTYLKAENDETVKQNALLNALCAEKEDKFQRLSVEHSKLQDEYQTLCDAIPSKINSVRIQFEEKMRELSSVHKVKVDAAVSKATEKVTRESGEKMERLYHRISELEKERFQQKSVEQS